jgi:glycyl-tRNA synthetase beta chain
MGARDLLFELGTEELPPVTLRALSSALTDGIVKGLGLAGVGHGEVQSFATPRRLAVLLRDCAERAADRITERRGPPRSASFNADGRPTPAALAFAKSCAVDVAALGTLENDRGAWLMFRGREPGLELRALIGTVLAESIAALPIAKRMRWGGHTAEFVRPVHWVVLLFGTEILPIELLGIPAGRETRGHRFHAPGSISLPSAGSYQSALRAAHVIADIDERRSVIETGVMALAAECGGRALIDPTLLDEVTALVEWPVPIAGQFEERFLALPREVVIATVQEHQRYFPVEAADGRLMRWFVTVSNIQSSDPAKVREGNERVVRPRLSDAAFFWDQDRKLSLQEHAAKLASVTFQTKLGSYADKTRRVQALAQSIGARIGAGPEVGRAAELAKADLMTAMVGEFPELQGTMGRYYALAQGEPDALAIALEEQYRPRNAGDGLPATAMGRALSLADRLDTLTGIFAIDQKPTGTKDPFGLRRAALGVLRIILEARLELDLLELLEASADAQPVQREGTAAEVHAFMLERLRGLIQERGDGSTPEMIDAVFASRPRSALDAVARLAALREFLLLPDAAVLAAANKRIVNILKKLPDHTDAAVAVRHLIEPAERGLYDALRSTAPRFAAALGERRYADGFRIVAALRPSIDRFFDEVMVMDENADLRSNRIGLLRELEALFTGVADLSRLPG